jgi:hypothetical protein
MSIARWSFAGYPTVRIENAGLGLKDEMNKAWAAATGGQWAGPENPEETFRQEEIRRDPTLRDDFDFHYESMAERRARNKYEDL